MTDRCEDTCCPFAFTDISERVQNYGCLPTPGEFIRIKEETGHNLSCHDDATKVCIGFARHMKEIGKPIRGGLTISNELWQTHGPEHAIAVAEGRA